MSTPGIDPSVLAAYQAKYGSAPPPAAIAQFMREDAAAAPPGQTGPGPTLQQAGNAGIPMDSTDALFSQALSSHAGGQADPTDAMFASALLQAHSGAPAARSNLGIGAPAPSVPPPSTLSDILRSGATGLAKGAADFAGMAGDVRELGDAAVGAIGGKNAANVADKVQQFLPFLSAPSSSDINSVVSNAVGGYHVPSTTAGRYTQTVGEFAPSVLGGEGGLVKKAILNVALPAVGSQAAGDLAKGEGPTAEALARVGGALAGGAPALVGNARQALGRFLTSSLNPSDASLIQKAEQLGLQIRPGQYNPSRFVRQADSVLSDIPSQGALRVGANPLAQVTNEAQGEQYTRLLSNTFGENTDRITGDVIANAKQRIGNKIDSITSGYSINHDPQTISDIGNLQNALSDVSPALKSEDTTRIAATLNKVQDLLNNGLEGANYQSMRQRGGLLQGLSDDANPTVAAFGQKIRGLLDNAFDRQVPASEAAALAKARGQYRAVSTVEPIANASPTGQIPGGAALLGKVVSEYGNPSKAGDLGTLAQVGKAYLREQPSSGTSERGFWRNLLTHPGRAVEELATIPLSLTVGRGLNAAINSPAARARALGLAVRNRSSLPSTSFLVPTLASGDQQ